MITKCAIRQSGKVYVGDTHQEVIYKMITKHKIRDLYGEQGFINDRRKFLSREDAAKEALSCGQISELKFSKDMLFIEDIQNAEATLSFHLVKDNRPQKASHWFSNWLN